VKFIEVAAGREKAKVVRYVSSGQIREAEPTLAWLQFYALNVD